MVCMDEWMCIMMKGMFYHKCNFLMYVYVRANV